MMYKLLVISTFWLSWGCCCFAQSNSKHDYPPRVRHRIDSLELLLKKPMNDSLRAETLFKLSRSYLDFDLKKCIELRFKAYKLAGQWPHPDLQPRMASLLSLPLINTNRLYEAERYLKESLAYFEKSDRLEEYTRALAFAGYLYRKKGEHAQSLEAFLKVIQINEPKEMLGIYNHIGILYNERGEFRQALNYLSKIDAYYQKKGEPNRYTASLYNLAMSYIGLNETDKARECLDRYKVSKIKRGNYNSLGLVYVSLSELAIMEGKPRLAIAYQDTARYYFEKLNIAQPIASRYIAKGKIYLDQKEYKEALYNFDKAEQIAKESGIRSTLLPMYKAKAEAFSALNNFEQAFHFQKLFEALNDSLNSTKSTELMAQLERDYLMEKANKEKELLNKENQLQELQIEKQRNFQLSLMALLALGAGILALVWKQSRIRKNNQMLLLQKNKIIEKALEEKEYLFKEIHHRVKNNLQIVSSLLYLQSQHIADGSALEALREGRSRVQSMALIHQNLYQEDNLSGVDVKTYFGKLAKSLFDSYKVQQERIQLHTEIEALNLDVDTLIPLALILNELLSNALKYAFPDDRKGNLTVKIGLQDENLLLRVADDGIGLPANFDKRQHQSLGYELIRLFAQKLNARLDIVSDGGTEVTLKIAKFKVV